MRREKRGDRSYYFGNARGDISVRQILLGGIRRFLGWAIAWKTGQRLRFKLIREFIYGRAWSEVSSGRDCNLVETAIPCRGEGECSKRSL
jgi:hypothetical protein